MPQGRAGDTKLSRTSINTYVRGCKAFWSWLERERIIDDNPLTTVKSPKLPKLLPKIYSEDELKSVFKSAAQSPRDSALLELFLDSGLRLSELVGLTMGDIHIAGGSLRVTGKGDKQRDGYFSPQTALTLDSYVRFHRPASGTDDRLFLSFDGHPLTNSRVQKILERIGRKAGIGPRLSPHKLRHTYATFSLRNGCNLEYLRRLMGHSNAKTTGVYLHLSSTDLHDAHRSFSPIRNLLKENSQGWCIVGGKRMLKGTPEYYEAYRRSMSR